MAWISPVLSGIGALSGLFGGGGAARRSQRLQDQALRNQNAMSQEQLGLFRSMLPFLNQSRETASGLLPGMGADSQKALNFAASYDPAKQTEDLTRAYDVNLRGSLGRDLGSATAGAALKGFTSGTGDSDTGQVLQNTLASRAGQRASYIGGLKANEPNQLMSILGGANQNAQGTFQTIDPASAVFGRYGGAIGSLNGPSGTQGELGQQYGQQASAWDPKGAIGSIGGAFDSLWGKGGIWNNKSGTAGTTAGTNVGSGVGGAVNSILNPNVLMNKNLPWKNK